MSPVDIRPNTPPKARRATRVPQALIAIAGIALATVGAASAREPDFVDRLDVVNRAPYELSVDVRGDGDTAWLPLGYVLRDTTTTVHDVLDQGDAWTFRFTGQGRDAGEVTVTRAALARAGWRLQVPGAVENHLRSAGVPLSP